MRKTVRHTWGPCSATIAAQSVIHYLASVLTRTIVRPRPGVTASWPIPRGLPSAITSVYTPAGVGWAGGGAFFAAGVPAAHQRPNLLMASKVKRAHRGR